MTNGKTHFADDETLKYIAELEETLRGIRMCAQIDGRREWKAIANQITQVLANRSQT